MLLEQETASIISYILKAAGSPSPYYWQVPENFQVPSIYFPLPEIETDGETFLTYGMDYSMLVLCFDSTREKARELAYSVVTRTRAGRNLIPLLDQEGNIAEGQWVRTHDPDMKILEDGAAQIAVTWRSRRPYKEKDAPIAMEYWTRFLPKEGHRLTDGEAEMLMGVAKEG